MWCLFAYLLFLLFIWLFWKGESENERNESGLGKCLALSSVR